MNKRKVISQRMEAENVGLEAQDSKQLQVYK